MSKKHYEKIWRSDMERPDSKLRTFKLFKNDIKEETYLKELNDKHAISVMSKLE